MSTKDIYKKTSAKNEYWQDVENKVLDPKVLSNEFSDDEFDSFSVKKDRRSFLKIMGYSVSALPLAGCIKIPVRKAVPYILKNDTVIPGVANWYATTIGGYPVLAKTREGRPIKIEGNAKSSFTRGGANAQMQAAVISLYDSYRYNAPEISSQKLEWKEFDTQAKAKLAQVKESGKSVVLVTSPMRSPSEVKLINEFSKKTGAKVVTYGSTQNQAILDANEATFGKRVEAEYDFEKADVIVSFGADFLGTFGNDVAHTKQYSSRRNPSHKRGLNKHFHIESLMSLTGSNADSRFSRGVKEQRDLLSEIYKYVSGKETSDALATKIGLDLVNAAQNSVVVSNDDSVEAQLLVNAINSKLGSFGTTVKVFESPFIKNSDNSAFSGLITDMSNGTVGAVLFSGVNPAYDYIDSKAFVSAIKKVDMRLSFAMAKDETSALCNFIAPTNHQLESWGDTQVSMSEYAFSQPTVQALFGTRQASETLMSLAEIEGTFFDYIKKNWSTEFYKKSNQSDGEDYFWNKSLHDGVVSIDSFSSALSPRSIDTDSALTKLKSMKYPKMMVATFEKTAIRNGAEANNPFLQEMPDPITKGTWDNYAMISPKFAKENSIKSGDVVTLKSKTHSVTVPAVVQAGTAYGTFGVAVGYGRTVAGKVAKNLGGNAFAFKNHEEVSIAKTGEFRQLALTQTHHSMEGRDIIRETTQDAYVKDAKSGNYKKARLVNIYPEHDKTGHQWAMAIDLNQCTGCSACIVSCNAENNVPVVGRQEIANKRDMHWMRLDRYYKGDENEPEVMHMPMLCQHCENAPCENVCPVLATVHSSDGINQQIYNRCVGTRYCANNCPYKVRRFNWFNYDRGDSMAKMALNPDISQRSRGVMEKCSFCIQRIQEGKLEAKKERRDLKDGDIKVACAQSCPGDAIVFGDMNDPKSKIAAFLKNERNYTVLEELNVRPRVSYLTKIRNK